MIHIFIHTTKQQTSTKQHHEMTSMIQKFAINFHCLRSTANFAVNCKIQPLGPNRRDDMMCVSLKGFIHMDELVCVRLQPKVVSDKLAIRNQNPSTCASFRPCNHRPVWSNFPRTISDLCDPNQRKKKKDHNDDVQMRLRSLVFVGTVSLRVNFVIVFVISFKVSAFLWVECEGRGFRKVKTP